MNKKKFKKLVHIFLSLIILFNYAYVISYANPGDPATGILGEDIDSKGYRALTFTVNPVSSTSPLQGFAVGWHVKIKGKDGNDFAEVYLPTPPQFNGKQRKYYLPLSKEYRHPSGTGEIVSPSIESQIGSTKAGEYQDIVRNPGGSEFYVDARIQKYAYSSSRSPKYQPVSPAVYADNMNQINSDFKEFTDSFKNNLPGNYFDLYKKFPPEPPKIIPDPQVDLTLPIHESTVYQGTTVTFKGTGINCHHVTGFVDGVMLSQQDNPSNDIGQKMIYEEAVTLDELRDYKFQIKGRNAESGGTLIASDTHIVHVKKRPPNVGTIYIKCLNIDTNSEIPGSSQAPITDVIIGQPRSINYPGLTEYKVQGSFQTFSTSKPEKTKMQMATSQTVTLTITNNEAYVYFWYKYDPSVPPVKPPVKFNYDPIAIIDNPPLAYAGDDVLIDGSQSYDEDGYIERYIWYVPGTDGGDPDNPWSITLNNSGQDTEKGTVWYPKVGKYDIDLEVVDDGNCSGYDKSTIEIIEPKPEVVIDVLADKMKENRKITLDTSKSKSAARFPIDWNLTTWVIQPVDGTGATGDYGVRLQNGTVYKNVNNIAYLYKGGAWQNTGVAFISVLKGQKTIQFQARDSGKYKITVSMTNTSVFNSAVHYSNTIERTITIVEDLPPSAAFNCPESVIREHDNPLDPKLQKYGICEVSCTSVSPDGDSLGKRVWGLRYDSDNDVDFGLSDSEAFGDETTIEPYTGSEPFTSGIRLVVDNEYDSTAEIWSYKVGYTTNSLRVFEDIPDNETVKELLIPSDFKSGYVQGW